MLGKPEEETGDGVGEEKSVGEPTEEVAEAASEESSKSYLKEGHHAAASGLEEWIQSPSIQAPTQEAPVKRR